MSKSRSFSIYLLKSGYDASNALKDDHSLEDRVDASDLPKGALLFVLDNRPREPWWKGYFGIKKSLLQVTKGALIFLPVRDRCFALSFGQAFHKLKDTSYEYDFGLRVTLNSVDPNRLKSTDVLEPGAARRQRTQVPVDSNLTYFDFDRDSTVLKSLTGKVKDEHVEFFKHATGASNLRISSAVIPQGLVSLCEKLLTLYQSDVYKKTFPEIQNITPIRDPVLVEKLNARLLEALRTKDEALALVVPDLINYQENVYASFAGAGESLVYDDVFLPHYYAYLESRNKEITDIDLNELRKHSLQLADEEGFPRERYSIYKSLICDTSIDGGLETYHLCEGNWYKVEDAYLEKLKAFLDPLCTNLNLPAYTHENEGDYNEAVANSDPSFLCLDKKNISLVGQAQVEPCDLYAVEDGCGVLYHVKVSTLSSQLSHLFNQGANAIELLRLESQARDKFRALVEEGVRDDVLDAFIEPLNDINFRVVFGIVTHKERLQKSRNLPLFSRISLMRNIRALQLMSVKAHYGFIEDQSPKGTGKKRRHKKAEVAE